MTTSNGRIDDFVVGNDLEVERTISSIPSGIIVSTAWLTVKHRYNDLDSEAIISKIITSGNLVDTGWIEDAGADSTALIHFYLTPADTILLTPLSEYPYSIKLKFNNGKVNTPEIGVIVAFPEVKQGDT